MRRRMKFGLGIPNCREGLYYPPGFAGPEDVVGSGVLAEQIGFDSVWCNDHYTPPDYVGSLWRDPPNFFEPLVTLSAVAAKTSTVDLGVAVVVLPIREPVLLAKSATTLDAFSKGRLILGVGLGSYGEEFDRVCGARTAAERPALLDEKLEALRLLLTRRTATYHGRYVDFEDVSLQPRAYRGPLRLYVGGNAERGIERVARHGDGWVPAALGAGEIAGRVRLLRSMARTHHRDPSKIEIAPQFTVCMRMTRDEAVRAYRGSALFKHVLSLKGSTFRGRAVDDSASKNLVGSPDDIIERIDALAKSGVQHLSALLFVAKDLREYRRSVRLFAKEVIPSFGS